MSTGVQMPTELIRWCWELDSGPLEEQCSPLLSHLSSCPGVYLMAMISARRGAMTEHLPRIFISAPNKQKWS